MTNFGFDLQNTPDMEFVELPDGIYSMLIDKVHKVAFQDGKKVELNNDDPNPDARIEFMFQVADGSYQGSKFNQLFNVYNDGTAGQIARSKIKKIVECCNIDLTSASFDELQNKIVVLEIKTTPNKDPNGKPYRNIGKISPMTELVMQKPAAAQPSVAPANNAKPSWGL